MYLYVHFYAPTTFVCVLKCNDISFPVFFCKMQRRVFSLAAHTAVPLSDRAPYAVHTFLSEDTAGMPFGAIGGMPSVCEHLVKTLLTGRINGEYVLNELSRAHCLLACSSQSAQLQQFDAVQGLLAWLINKEFTDAPDAKGMNESVNTAFTERVNTFPEASWVPRTGPGIRTANLDYLKTLDRAQLKGRLAEEVILRRLSAMYGEQQELQTAVCAILAIKLERIDKPHMRALYKDEMVLLLLRCIASLNEPATNASGTREMAKKMNDRERSVLQFISAPTGSQQRKARQLGSLARQLWEKRDLDVHPLCSTRDQSTLREQVQQQPSTEEPIQDLLALLASMILSTSGAVPVLPVPSSTDMMPLKVMHISLVHSHEEFPRSGDELLRSATAMADDAGLPMFLEGMLQNAIPVFVYALRHGFIPVMVSAKPTSERLRSTQLDTRGWVHMYRPVQARGSGAGSSSSSSSNPLSDALARWAAKPVIDCALYKTSPSATVSEAVRSCFASYFNLSPTVARVQEIIRQVHRHEIVSNEEMVQAASVSEGTGAGIGSGGAGVGAGGEEEGDEEDAEDTTEEQKQLLRVSPGRPLTASALGLRQPRQMEFVAPPPPAAARRGPRRRSPSPSPPLAAPFRDREPKRIKVTVDGMEVTVIVPAGATSVKVEMN